MIKKNALSPETTREIENLANDMSNLFSPPELIPGCVVMSIDDRDEYADNNGWVEAICGKHNQQRVRWRGQYSNIQLGDYLDVLYFKSIRLFTTMGRGGTAQIPQPPILNQTFYLHTEAADVATYEQLLTDPVDDTEVIDNVSLVAGDGEVLIDAYISYPTTGLGTTLLEAGTWEFHIFGRVDNVATGNSTIICKIYKRTSAGVETLLFSVETPNLTTTVAEYVVSTVEADEFIDSSDRLVAKFYATTTSVASRTVYLYYEGTTNYTHFHTPIDILSSGLTVWPRASQANIDNVAYTVIDDWFDALASGVQGIIGEGSFTTDYDGGHGTVPTGADVRGSGIDVTVLTSAGSETIEIAGASSVEKFSAINTNTNGYTFVINTGADARVNKVYAQQTGSGTSVYVYYIYAATALLINCEAEVSGGTNNYAIYATNAATVEVRGGYYDGDVYATGAGTTIHLDGPTITGNVTEASSGVITGWYKNTDGDILPAPSSLPDLANATNKWGDIFLASTKDIYPGGDSAGLFQRVNGWRVMDLHFTTTSDLSSNFTWDAVNFAGTPDNISIAYNSVLRIYDTTGTNDFFAYKTLDSSSFQNFFSTVSIGDASSATNYGYSGIRFDNPAAPTTNYVEIRMIPSATYTRRIRLRLRYNIGGGLVTSDFVDGLPSGLWRLGLSYTNSITIGAVYYTKDSPLPLLSALVSSLWTSSTLRGGIIIGHAGVAGVPSRSAIFDSWDDATS